MSPLFLHLLLSGLAPRTYQALKSQYYNTYAAHKSEKDGAEDWEHQYEWVVDLEIVFVVTYKEKFLRHVSRCEGSILTAHAAVVTDLEGLIAVALSAAVSSSTDIRLIIATQECDNRILFTMLHHKVPVSSTNWDSACIWNSHILLIESVYIVCVQIYELMTWLQFRIIYYLYHGQGIFGDIFYWEELNLKAILTFYNLNICSESCIASWPCNLKNCFISWAQSYIYFSLFYIVFFR